jgi:hypothetical protein
VHAFTELGEVHLHRTWDATMDFEIEDIDAVKTRLTQSGLIPPVRAITATGKRDEDDILIVDVEAELTPELSARVSEAFGDLPHELRTVPPNRGTFYGGGTRS